MDNNDGPPTQGYLRSLGIADLPPKTVAFDPGYDPNTVLGHLEQSSHLMSQLKLSMACWQICNADSTREKIAAAKSHSVLVSAGGGPFEVATACNRLPEYLDLCAAFGFGRIEAGEGFVALALSARDVLKLAGERGLSVHFEIGGKHAGSLTPQRLTEIIRQGEEWLDAGASQLIVEARESAANVGLFDAQGNLDVVGAETLVNRFGMDRLIFETPNKSSQFAFIRHFGPTVELCNVRLEEILRVEIYRRGLHSDAFMHRNLRPAAGLGDGVKVL